MYVPTAGRLLWRGVARLASKAMYGGETGNRAGIVFVATFNARQRQKAAQDDKRKRHTT